MASQYSAIELLYLGDADRKKTVLTQYWPQILGVTFGVATGVFLNFTSRRPLFSGIQKHLVGVAGWTGILTFLQMKRNEYYAEKDAVLRHYVELHPEDFPCPERKKIGEIFEEWTPIR